MDLECANFFCFQYFATGYCSSGSTSSAVLFSVANAVCTSAQLDFQSAKHDNGEALRLILTNESMTSLKY